MPAGRATCVAGRGGQGCGIVEFESAESAAEAINTLHLSEVCSILLYICCAFVDNEHGLCPKWAHRDLLPSSDAMALPVSPTVMKAKRRQQALMLQRAVCGC